MSDPVNQNSDPAADLLSIAGTASPDATSVCSYYGMTSSASSSFFTSAAAFQQQNAPLPTMASFYSRDSTPFVTLSGMFPLSPLLSVSRCSPQLVCHVREQQCRTASGAVRLRPLIDVRSASTQLAFPFWRKA